MIRRKVAPANAPRIVPEPPEWTLDALCLQFDPDTFFAEQGEADKTRTAKRICSACPVVSACLTAALDRDEAYGVFGGLTATERKRLRRRPASRIRVPGHGTAAGYRRHLRAGEASCAACREAARNDKRRRVAERREEGVA